MSQQEFSHALVSLKPNLERFAYSLTANPEDANDLIQETYLKALSNRDKFRESSNIKAWTFTIMKNTFINDYRKAVNRHTTNDTSANQHLINRKYEDYGPDSMYSYQEITQKIEALSDDYKLPFELYNSGYKYKEIADKLNLKIGTVKSRIFFTRQKLMESLKEYR